MNANDVRGIVFGGIPSVLRDRKVFIPYASTDDDVATRAWPDHACETEDDARAAAERLFEQHGFTH
jgi:hypothetical protein